jgi:hypothetical protein
MADDYNRVEIAYACYLTAWRAWRDAVERLDAAQRQLLDARRELESKVVR